MSLLDIPQRSLLHSDCASYAPTSQPRVLKHCREAVARRASTPAHAHASVARTPLQGQSMLAIASVAPARPRGWCSQGKRSWLARASDLPRLCRTQMSNVTHYRARATALNERCETRCPRSGACACWATLTPVISSCRRRAMGHRHPQTPRRRLFKSCWLRRLGIAPLRSATARHRR